MEYEIGFLGYGRMARAISEGLDQSGVIPYRSQIVSGRDRRKLDQAAETFGVAPAADNRDLTRRAKVVLLGVKPKQVATALEEIQDDLTEAQLIISMAAGVRLKNMARLLLQGVGLVRVMPNVAAMVGQGLTLACAAPGTTPAHLAKTREIFESVGQVVYLEEDLFDAGGAVSGSGPAYVFTFMESLVRGAVRQGLSWEAARDMVLQTTLGAAAMAAQRPEASLSQLRDMVTSPGGTTAEALYILEKEGFGGTIQRALEAAVDKSRKLT